MYVTPAIIAAAEVRYGEPRELHVAYEIRQDELAMIRASQGDGRAHDVTLFVFNAERLALIRKPHFAPGLWRTPGGGIRPGEDFLAGVAREGLEELGVDIELERYVVRAEAMFRHRQLAVPWQTHVFSATTAEEELEPVDVHEIEAARWGTAAELAGPIRARLLETGRALWRYRVALHDAALAQLG